MPSSREKLQQLLRELFQFGSADLDFGIYRIMNFKRDAIERFIKEDLIEAVDKELSSGMLASQSQAALELKEVAAQIRETLGETALNGDGSLEEAYHGTPLGKHYLELQARASQAQERPAFEATIFNHLYAFFSRYYDNGDFLSKRRYSRREKYAIPYNGEEVYLHWANNDQYYVKTGEYFNDYRFKSPYGISVHFKLVAMDVEKDNVKGDKRFFLPLSYEVAFDEEKKEITIPFQYRSLTAQEEIKYGQRNQQDAITKESLITIPAKLEKDVATLPALLSAHHTTADGQQVNYLEYHLRRYTRRNTSDFFVHKDLKGFLTRELDFYLKNEVLNLDEIEATGESRSEAWFQIMRVIRSIGSRVIDFLAQTEDFQKRLFEKKKFILETQYCITLANIPEDFYAEIIECEAQWQEWKDLLHLDEEQPNLFTSAAKNKKGRRLAALKERPTLVIDTKHFNQQFKDRLLASFENLDEITDGLLVHSENFQALNLLVDRYRESVKCIYIDPPYNKGGEDDFLYKDDYQSSSWASMILDRLVVASYMLSSNGILFGSIDDNEFQSFLRLSQQSRRFQGVKLLPAITNLKGNYDAEGFVATHEYVICACKGPLSDVSQLLVDEEKIETEWESDEYGLWKKGDNLRRTGADSSRERRPKGWFPIFISKKGGSIYVTNDDRPLDKDDSIIWPVNSDGQEMSWTWQKSKITRDFYNLVVEGESPQLSIYKKQRPLLGEIPTRKAKSFLYKPEYSSTHGGNLVKDLFGYRLREYTPKSLALISDLISLGIGEADNQITLDFFAGSGTTGHAVISLNRNSGHSNRFILVEIGRHFDEVLIPRILKAIYTPDWRDGKPARQASTEEAERSPRIVKYLRLESYEDTLNNITFPDVPKTLYDFDDYLLKYMLAWETKESETLLNIEQLASPCGYKLTVTSGEETQQKPVDIPETFVYLLGLNVKTRRVYQDKKHDYLVYRGNIDHREIVVIWRETSGWEKADYERDKKFVEEQKLTEEVDEIFVNGDSYIPEARALESVFKNRMFGRM